VFVAFASLFTAGALGDAAVYYDKAYGLFGKVVGGFYVIGWLQACLGHKTCWREAMEQLRPLMKEYLW